MIHGMSKIRAAGIQASHLYTNQVKEWTRMLDVYHGTNVGFLDIIAILNTPHDAKPG